jgi:di/tricarboxylate transporter
MPLAFGSILGGMTTLIGTPPNLIVSGFRVTEGAPGFAILDFAPVGVAVAAVGVAFVGLIGWRMVPARKHADTGTFEFGAYISEVRIVGGSKAVNKSLGEVEQLLDEADAQIVGLVRGDVRLSAPSSRWILRQGDVLVIEVEPASLASALSRLGLKLEEDVRHDARVQGAEDEAPERDEPAEKVEKKALEKPRSNDVQVQEFVVTPNSALVTRTATDIELRTRYGINLLAISHRGRRTVRRLRSTRIEAGDVLLLQGAAEAVSGFAAQFSCLPLAQRGIRVPKKGEAVTASLVMAAAVCAAAFGFLPASISFAAGALAFVALGVVPIRSIYSAVDWPVIVLLGAMLPVADAMAKTGTADVIAHFLLETVAQGNAVGGLVVLLVVTMFLSSVMNNAATAAVMCPIAIRSATQLGVSADAFLMAIAVGASCSFLTPLSHQNNTLILGPGGFHFGDYWRLGLVLQVIVTAVAVPMLLWVWPL